MCGGWGLELRVLVVWEKVEQVMRSNVELRGVLDVYYRGNWGKRSLSW